MVRNSKENGGPGASVRTAILRGLKRRCPNCGVGNIYEKYLKVVGACSHCQEHLGHIRADDFPPYLTIVIGGHIVVPLILLSERTLHPPTWLMFSIALPMTLALTLWLMPRVKGGVLALMWHLSLRGDETQ